MVINIIGNNLAWAMFIILPAYFANGIPVLTPLIFRRRIPIDLGLTFIDGKRLIGDNKSIQGVILGIVSGLFIGKLQSILLNDYMFITRALVLSLGSVCGDILGSFIKRRLRIEPGGTLPVVDQMSFILVAILLYIIIFGDLNDIQILFVLGITPIIHLIANIFAHILGIKKVPY
ncbi:MAG: CDP-2,3-bis-(O-geranylgeranyl)-sn-glycerol synthase [Candidatus Methanomethylicia archaeon]